GAGAPPSARAHHSPGAGRTGTPAWPAWYERATGRPERRERYSRAVARETIKVLLVDDHPVFRDGLRQCLEARKEFKVLAAVGSGEEMWKAIRTHGRPHVVLMDVEMPGEGGIELTKALHEKHPDVGVVTLTAFSDSERIFAALKAGAVGSRLQHVSPAAVGRT